jgi:hypothetical protein
VSGDKEESAPTIGNKEDAEEDEDTKGLAYETGSLNEEEQGEDLSLSSASVQQSLYFTQLVLIILETIMKTCPLLMCGQSSFDLTRLLDEVVPWAMDLAPAGAVALMRNMVSEPVQEHYRDVLVSTLRVLTLATSQGHCKWFGSRQDVVKAIAAAVVSREWEMSSKRSALAKLVMLTTLQHNVTDDSPVGGVVEASDRLLESVFVQSDLFCGHGVADNELLVERNSWVTVLKISNGSNFVLLFDILLRVSHHWNVDACMGANDLVRSLSTSPQSDSGCEKDYVQLRLVPFSPIVFCAVSLGCANLSMVHSLLPKHIQTRYDALGTAPTNTEHTDAVQFFSRFSETFRKDMEILLSQIILRALPWYASPTSFLDVMVSLVKHMDTVTPLSGGSVTELATKMRVLLQQIPTGASKSVKRARRTRSVSMTESDDSNYSIYDVAVSAHSALRDSSASASILSAEDIAKCAIDGSLTPQVEMAWALVLESTLKANAISLQLLEWIGQKLENESATITVSSFEHKIAMTVYAVRMIHHLAVLIGSDSEEGAAASTRAATRSKKRTKDVASETSTVDGDVKQQLEELVSSFTMIVVECIRSTGCATQIASALNVSYVVQSFTESSVMGQSFLQILFAAVVSQYRQMQSHTKKKQDIQSGMSFLWSAVCAKLNEIDFAASVEADKGLFALCWSIQMVHDDSQLRRVFVSYALEEGGVESRGGGFQLTSLAQAQCHHLSRDLKQVTRGLSSYVLAPIHTSMLNSANMEALEKAVRGLLECYAEDKDANGDDAARDILVNALCGTVVTTKSVVLGAVSLSIPSHYCDVLSMLKLTDQQPNDYTQRILLSSFSSGFKSTLQIAPASDGKKRANKTDAKSGLSADAVVVSNYCLPFLSQEGLSLKEISNNLLVSWSKAAPLDAEVLDRLFSEAIGKNTDHLSNELTGLCTSLMHIDKVSSSPLCENMITLLHDSNTTDTLSIVLPSYLHGVSVLVDITGDSSISQHWLDLFKMTLQLLVDKAAALMKSGDVASSLSKIFHAIQFILSMEIPCDSDTEKLVASCCERAVALCNKMIKSCLKYGLSNAAALAILENLMQFSNSSLARVAALEVDNEEELEQGTIIDYSLWLSKRRSNPTNLSLINCTMILEMLVSHSKFETSVEGNVSLLRFVLLLVDLTYEHMKHRECDLSQDCVTFLSQCLLRQYTGCMGKGDRIIMRVLFLSQKILDQLRGSDSDADEGTAVLNRSIFTYPPVLLAKNASMTSNSWILAALTPPMVYSTLAAFPTWRSLKPQPLEFEYESALLEHIAEIKSDTDALQEHVSTVASQQEEERAHKSAPRSKQLTPINESDEENEEDGDEETPDAVRYGHTRYVDMLHDLGNNVLDPSYWLPCIYLALAKNADLSMRQFANCGALAFVIACLTSDCVFIRSYAKACLHLVLAFLRKQTPDKDSAFRERPQLLVIVNFIRNAFNSAEQKGQFVEDHLPLTSGIFLGRAALHLLQPQHTLFSSMNKYLLSRPYCDRKDIPLYESLVVEGDVGNDAVTRLAALRLLRDCIGSKEDHLNMCRKNAYSRLMVYFVLFGKDAKSAHAILDILERALSFGAGARYLLERCALIPWLQQLASPINSSRILLQSGDAGADVSATGSDRDRSDENDMPLQAAPTRMLFRVVALLRKTVAALSLLEGEGVEVVTYLQHAFAATSACTREIMLLSQTSRLNESAVPFEFFRQIVLCMWDISVAVSTVDATDLRLTGLQWQPHDLLALSKISLQLYQSNPQIAGDGEKMVLCLMSLLALARNGGISSSLDAVDAQSALDLVIGTSTRHLYHAAHNAKKSLDDQPMCLMTQSLFHDGNSDAESKGGNKDLAYFSGLNIFYQDVSTYNHTALNLKHTSGHSMMVPRHDGPLKMEETIANIVQNNWSVLSSMQFGSTPLPFELGASFTLGIVFKTVILALLSLSGTEAALVSNSLSIVRWALVMKKCHLDSVVLDGVNVTSTRAVGSAVAARITCICDGGNVRDYLPGYMHFQKMVDAALTCVLALRMFLERSHATQRVGSVAHHMCDLLARTMAILCTGSAVNAEDASLIRPGSRHTAFGNLVWKAANGRCRVTALSVIEICCGLTSHFLTLHDRSNADNNEDHMFADALSLSPEEAAMHPLVSGLIAKCDTLDAVLTEFATEVLCSSIVDHQVSLYTAGEVSIELGDREGMWSDCHYTTKSSRTLGAYLLHENLDYGATPNSIGGFTFRPTPARSDTSINIMLQAMRQATQDSSRLGESNDTSMPESDRKQDVISTGDSELDGSGEEIYITRKRPRFHKLTFTPHFSRTRKTSYYCRVNAE